MADVASQLIQAEFTEQVKLLAARSASNETLRSFYNGLVWLAKSFRDSYNERGVYLGYREVIANTYYELFIRPDGSATAKLGGEWVEIPLATVYMALDKAGKNTIAPYRLIYYLLLWAKQQAVGLPTCTNVDITIS